MIQLLVLALILMVPSLALAAPSVTGVSGTVSSGQSITISGSGFGTKSTAQPQVWDNFEGGTVGQNLGSFTPSGALGGVWTAYNESGTLPVYSTTRAHSGTKSVQHPIIGTGSKFTSYGKTGLGATEIYYSVWWRWDIVAGTNSSTPIIKLYRMNSTPAFYSTSTSRPAIWATLRPTMVNGAVSSAGLDVEAIRDDTSAVETYDAHVTGSQDGAWHRGEVYWKLSQPAGTANGVFQIWEDGTLKVDQQNIITRANDTLAAKTIDNFLLPLMVDSTGLTSDVEWYWYADDVYVDKGLQRVEICSGSTWASKGTCEIQPPSAWSDTSATVTVNQGAFADSSSQYLYVVDSTGAGGTGRQITFGVSISAGSASTASGRYSLK